MGLGRIGDRVGRKVVGYVVDFGLVEFGVYGGRVGGFFVFVYVD